MKTLSKVRAYEVTVSTLQGDYVVGVNAINAAGAIKRAREDRRRDGYDRHDGPVKYAAKVAA